jgi:nitrate reductase NapE component
MSYVKSFITLVIALLPIFARAHSGPKGVEYVWLAVLLVGSFTRSRGFFLDF